MKYTIEGFNQRNAIAMGLSSDDLILLRWIIDFKEDGVMKKKYIPEINDMGYWISYKYVIQELPILFSMPPHISNEDYSTLTLKEKKTLNKNWINACKKKLQRMLSGNLSKVLSRDIEREKTKTDKGQNQIHSKVYVYINPLTFKFLISDSCGLYVDKNKKVVDKSVKFVDKNVDENKTVTTGQKCPAVTTGQKCPAVTTGQKCPVYSSTNILYSSTNTSENSTSEFKDIENHPNVKIFREKTKLQNKGRDFYKTITEWDYSKLVRALDEYIHKQGYSFTFLRDIYSNLKVNDNTTVVPKVQTRFHNVNQTFTKYTPEELEKLLQESQIGKFD